MIDPDRFWQLLPQYHQRRDVEIGGPLRALLEAFAEQAALIDADIARQYDNWFIETCEDWVVPYIGDLIGYTPVRDTGDPNATLKLEDEALRRAVTPRREVANTIRYRRRKGTLGLLEQIATDVAGWPSRAVEFRRHVVSTQHMRFPQPNQVGTASVRGGQAGDFSNPADALPRVAEVRRISTAAGVTRYGPHQVGLFVARHIAVPVTRASAACAETVGPNCFLFSPLEDDTILYRLGNPALGILPGPLTRAALTAPQTGHLTEQRHADPNVFGEGRSVMVWMQPAQSDPAMPPLPLQPLAARQILPIDLAQWDHRPALGNVALDPERGRLIFPERETPERVIVSYHEGALGDLGASQRPRRMSARQRAYFPVRANGDGESHDTLRAAIDAWSKERPADALIEIIDSGTYDEQRLSLSLQAGQRLEIRAAAGMRPLLCIMNAESSRDDSWHITGLRDSALLLDGLLIAARRIHVHGALGSLLVRRCTLVPGWGAATNVASAAVTSSLLIDNATTRVQIQHSIVGAIHVRDNEIVDEPFELVITDSIIGGSSNEAIVGPGTIAAHLVLTIRRSTVLGRCAVHEISLAEDCLFTSRLMVARRQLGCMRFCYIPQGSRTPHRFECVPAETDQSDLTLAPVFVSLRFGQPGYCQLSQDCPQQIRRGASDQGELGVFHNLFEPQREANLRARLAEYVPAAVDVDLIYLT